MTREEEIQKLIDKENGIDNYGSCDYQVGVCDGVRLADKTMIEKVCEWLIGEFSQKQDRDGHPNVESRSCVSVEELIQDFRKAMEE